MSNSDPSDGSQTSRPKTRTRRVLLLVGVALAVGAVAAVILVVRGTQLVVWLPPTELPPTSTVQPAEVAEDIAERMVQIEAGSFQMGTPDDDPERDADETWHEVTISRPFLLARTEVTQEQYGAVVREQPLRKGFQGVSLEGPDLPVAGVSWYDAVRFCNELSALAGLDEAYQVEGRRVAQVEGSTGYRLPTEAEWEYAARADAWQRYGALDDPAQLCTVANVADLQAEQQLRHRMAAPCDDGFAGPAPVGSLGAGPRGLHDMMGNVWEWTWDGYAGLDGDPVTDPAQSVEVAQRIARGGSWWDEPFCLRAATRESLRPGARRKDLGFRVARSLP